MLPKAPRDFEYPDWLTTCCGFVPGRRGGGFDARRSYFYSPSTANMDSWAMANHYATNPMSQQTQPYLLLTQPVIIANNSLSPHLNTMSLVQHAQTGTNVNPFQTLTLLNPHVPPLAPGTNLPSLLSSQCAIYSSTTGTQIDNTNLLKSYSDHQQQQQQQLLQLQKQQQPIFSNSVQNSQNNCQKQVKTLSPEIFKQLELIEKQADLSRDIELIERHGIVITRALDPYSLMPHLSEATLQKYNSRFLINDNYIIRFIEVIKRPGQTLGLYIRTVQFGDLASGLTRVGVVITKIDSDSPIYNSQVLRVGDEILSINLVDIQGMSLDDVVIIMSIPKRLVLAIRIPRDRDQLLSLNLMHHQQQFLRNPPIEQEKQVELLSLQQPWIQHNLASSNQQQQQHLMRAMNPALGGISSVDSSQRLHQEMSMNPCQEEVDFIMAPTMSRQDIRRELSDLRMPNHHHHHQEPLKRPSRVHSATVQTNNDLLTMSKESQDDFSAANLDFEERLAQATRNFGSSSADWFEHQTLPAIPNVEQLEPESKPIISNIRLGDTPEQSSYFSSSIDAINRELKELRRQRMVLSSGGGSPSKAANIDSTISAIDHTTKPDIL